jgi:hypothetical protein
MNARLAHIAVITVLLGAAAWAQETPPPRDNPQVMVDGKKVAVEYGQPSLGQRSFDELMKSLPEDRVWRAGTNQVTTLSTELPLMVGDKKVPAGKYSVYVHCPAEGDYSLILNQDLGQPLGKLWAEAPEKMKNEPWPHMSYTKEIGDQEVARAAMKKVAVEKQVDRFTIQLAEAPDGALMTLMWGDRAWALDLKAAK